VRSGLVGAGAGPGGSVAGPRGRRDRLGVGDAPARLQGGTGAGGESRAESKKGRNWPTAPRLLGVLCWRLVLRLMSSSAAAAVAGEGGVARRQGGKK
jgi:hypothetical protein